MEIEFLRHFGFQPSVIKILQQSFGEKLLPLQEKVIQDGGLFDHQNSVMCGPTSSGKTMLAEIIMLWHALHMRKVVLLVPTKALANQRYEEINHRYGDLGFDICLSTRDHSQSDHRILTGKFHLSILIYEKMQILSTIQPAWLSTLGCCIVDEFHYLHDAKRGADLELLLTFLRKFDDLQLITLSSTGSPKTIVDWLNANYIFEEKRPVELHQGVLLQQKFNYLAYNTNQEGIETLPLESTEDEINLLLNAAIHFAKKREINLLFFPRRELCYWAAKKMINNLEPEIDEVSSLLEEIEPSLMRHLFAELLPYRVIVHTSDLTSTERKFVEDLCQQGEILIICATNTLAEGINFPVNNVLTTAFGYSNGESGQKTASLPVPSLLDPAQLSNMIGRAGRKGYSQQGRGIIVTRSAADLTGLMRQYKNDHIKSRSSLMHCSLKNVLIKIIGYHAGVDAESIIAFMRDTYYGQLQNIDKDYKEKIYITLACLHKNNFISQTYDRFYLTALGELVCKKGIQEQTAIQIQKYINELEETKNYFSHLVFVVFLDEMNQNHVSISRNEIVQFSWVKELEQLCDENHFTLPGTVHDLLTNKPALRYEHHSACKKAVMLFHWLQGVDLIHIEKNFRTYAGNIIRLAEDAAWLLCCLKEGAIRFGLDSTRYGVIETIQNHVKCGVPLQYPEWMKLTADKTLTRRQTLTLIKHGVEKPEELNQYDFEWVMAVCPDIPKDWLRQIQSKQFDGYDRLDHSVTIGYSQAQPHKLYFEEQEILLTPTQSRLISCLAKNPNHCVEYETILKQVWPETVAERKQLSKQKLEIEKKIKHLGQSNFNAIETIPGQGLMLKAKIVEPAMVPLSL